MTFVFLCSRLCGFEWPSDKLNYLLGDLDMRPLSQLLKFVHFSFSVFVYLLLKHKRGPLVWVCGKQPAVLEQTSSYLPFASAQSFSSEMFELLWYPARLMLNFIKICLFACPCTSSAPTYLLIYWFVNFSQSCWLTMMNDKREEGKYYRIKELVPSN